jgi:hypothetical protein
LPFAARFAIPKIEEGVVVVQVNVSGAETS